MSTIKSYDVSVGVKSTDLSDKTYFPDIDIEKDSDEVIAKKIDIRINEAKPLHNKRCESAEDSMRLFRGRLSEISDAKANKFKSKSVLSRLFFTVRNLVGMATDAMPFVEIIPDNDNPKSVRRAKAIESNIEWCMLEADFQGKLSQALFDAWIKSDCFFMWFWNYDKDDVDLEVVGIEDLSISSEATSIQDAEFVVYHPYKGRSWWKERYPDVYKEGKIKFVNKTPEGVSDNNSVSERGNVARFIQYWENDVVIEKVASTEGEDIILKKVKNPYFEYRTDEEQKQGLIAQLQKQASDEQQKTMMGKVKSKVQSFMGVSPAVDQSMLDNFVPIHNYFIAPKKPFVQLPSIKLIGELYSEEVTQQVREVFLSMNEKKRAFADNLRGCNQKIIVDSNSYTKEEADKITDEPNQVLRADFTVNAKPVYIEKGGEVPASFHMDIQHDERYIDDLYGNHEISRGAGNSNTATQDQMNAQSDRTPIRFQSRATERAIIELTEGFLQLMRLFYTKTHYAKKWGQREGLEIIELINEDIEEGVKPHIKPGSMISVSREEKAARALQMFGQGAIDPYTMFVDLDMPNPAELANRLVNWLKFQVVSTEDPATMEADLMGGSDPILQSVEKANQENEGFQMGDNLPPTPEQYVTEDHVKTHFAFLGDNKKKMDDTDAELLRAHAEVDKATLTKKMAEGILKERQQGTQQGGQNTAPQQKPKK